jgi:hypothetical protein
MHIRSPQPTSKQFSFTQFFNPQSLKKAVIVPQQDDWIQSWANRSIRRSWVRYLEPGRIFLKEFREQLVNNTPEDVIREILTLESRYAGTNRSVQ